MFVFKIHLFGEIMAKNLANCRFIYVDIINTMHGLPQQQHDYRCSKTCITHKSHLSRLAGNGKHITCSLLILSISIGLCQEINMLGSRNGPLTHLSYTNTLSRPSGHISTVVEISTLIQRRNFDVEFSTLFRRFF